VLLHKPPVLFLFEELFVKSCRSVVSRDF